MAIRVRAVFPHGGFGFNGLNRLRDGDEFSIDDESQFSARWMELVGDEDPAPEPEPEPEPEPAPEPETERPRRRRRSAGTVDAED